MTIAVILGQRDREPARLPNLRQTKMRSVNVERRFVRVVPDECPTTESLSGHTLPSQCGANLVPSPGGCQRIHKSIFFIQTLPYRAAQRLFSHLCARTNALTPRAARSTQPVAAPRFWGNVPMSFHALGHALFIRISGLE